MSKRSRLNSEDSATTSWVSLSLEQESREQLVRLFELLDTDGDHKLTQLDLPDHCTYGEHSSP